MAQEASLGNALTSEDPLAAEDAITALSEMPPERAVAIATGAGIANRGAHHRYRRLAEALDGDLVSPLMSVFERGEWFPMSVASRMFSGVREKREAQCALWQRLKDRPDEIYTNMRVLEAFGELGKADYVFDIVDYATWGKLNPAGTRIPEYELSKFSSWGVGALALIFAREHDLDQKARAQQALMELAETRLKILPNIVPTAWNKIEDAQYDVDDRAIDLVVSEWGHSTELNQRSVAYTYLGQIKSVRTAAFLIGRMREESDANLGATAAIALGEARDVRVARQLAEAMDAGLNAGCGSLAWAYSTLYPLLDEWSMDVETVTDRVGASSEPACQLYYSRALRGEAGLEGKLIQRLDHQYGFVRGSAALALARLKGSDAAPELAGRDDEASGDLERCQVLAARIHAGARELGRTLHEALQTLDYLQQLRTVWKAELLDALRIADGVDQRTWPLWCAEARFTRRAIKQFHTLLEMAGHAALAPDAGAPAPPAAAAAPDRDTAPPRLFVSYSHADAEDLKALRVMMAPLLRDGFLELWDDQRIRPGRWRDQIFAAMEGADAALFLASPNFLASDFVMAHELPKLLRAADERGLTIYWMLLDHCHWEGSALEPYQCAHDPARPLAALASGERNQVLKEVSRRILDAISPRRNVNHTFPE